MGSRRISSPRSFLLFLRRDFVSLEVEGRGKGGEQTLFFRPSVGHTFPPFLISDERAGDFFPFLFSYDGKLPRPRGGFGKERISKDLSGCVVLLAFKGFTFGTVLNFPLSLWLISSPGSRVWSRRCQTRRKRTRSDRQHVSFSKDIGGGSKIVKPRKKEREAKGGREGKQSDRNPNLKCIRSRKERGRQRRIAVKLLFFSSSASSFLPFSRRFEGIHKKDRKRRRLTAAISDFPSSPPPKNKTHKTGKWKMYSDPRWRKLRKELFLAASTFSADPKCFLTHHQQLLINTRTDNQRYEKRIDKEEKENQSNQR